MNAKQAAERYARLISVDDEDLITDANTFLAGAAWQREQILALLRSEEADDDLVYGLLGNRGYSSPSGVADWLESQLKDDK